VLAYNLGQENTTTRGREKLWDILQNEVPVGSRVLLSCGEIDCRAHLLKHVRKGGPTIEAVAARCVERYWSVITEIAQAGYRPLIYNVVPSVRASGRRQGKGDEYTAIGTCQERNEAARCFNRELARRCAKAGHGFLNNFDGLVRPSGLSDRWYYMDNIHLSQKAMPLTMQRLQALVPELGLPLAQVPSVPTTMERVQFYLRGRRKRFAKEIQKALQKLGVAG
jgi:hypothetical protein